MTVTESFKRFRKDFNLTKTAVASTLGIRPTSYELERTDKDANPTAKTLIKLAKAYNISTDYLLGLSDEPRPLNKKVEMQEVPPIDETTEDTQSLKAEIQSLKEQVAVLQLAVAKLAG